MNCGSVSSDEKYQNFIFNMNDLRRFKALTQEDVAKAVGISKGSIGFYENFTRECDLTTAIKIADFFNTTIDKMCEKREERFDPATIHGRIKGLRVGRGLTIREIAKEMNVVPSSWCYIEQGKKELKVDLCRKIARYFGVSADYIIFGETGEGQDV